MESVGVITEDTDWKQLVEMCCEPYLFLMELTRDKDDY